MAQAPPVSTTTTPPPSDPPEAPPHAAPALPPHPAPPAVPPIPATSPLPPLDPPGTKPWRHLSLKRTLLGCVLVIAASAGIGALLVLNEVSTLRVALSQNPSLKLAAGTLAPAGWGDPQTLLLVGDDQRALTKYYHNAVLPHSNEMLLVRIDPSKPYISMMSIPRDLQATIYPPGQSPVTTRFNYAYTAGGIPLLVSTIKRVIGLSINHVVVITFARFKQAVNELGCAYSTVDRRYYHVNVPGGPQYQEIDLQPGYQRLCGVNALQFVSYRHGDTALVRDSRDQSFLLDVKREYGPTLIGNIHKFEHIFGQVVATDPSLHTNTGILNLIGTLISSASLRVRQVQFQVNLLPGEVTATPQQIAANVHSFLYGADKLPTKRTAAAAHAVRRHRVVATLPLDATPPAELAAAQTAAAKLPFPLEYPRVRDALASGDPVSLSGCPAGLVPLTCMRTYRIHAPDGRSYPAYVLVVSAGLLGQYYDVQGTTWDGGPQFASPEQTLTVSGRTYDLYYEGQHLKMIAWAEHGAVYWIHNTLLDSVGNGALLAIAEQTRPVSGGAPGAKTRLRAVSVPVRSTAPAAAPTTTETIGSLGGLLTLLALPLLGVAVLKRRRELGAVRARLHDAAEREARLAVAAHAAGIPAYASAAPGSTTGAWTAPVYGRGSDRGPRRLLVPAGIIATVAVVAFFGIRALESSGQASRSAAARAPTLPTMRVAVLNATPSPGAAHRLAVALQSRGVKIAGTGNLIASLPAGIHILYAPAARGQATRLARLLSARSPSLEQMNANASVAAGGARLAVVIA
jgi:polyisoprenyl-teichoic acid--peptidoglycan teichoic acid transferase